jgi:hypothetical protein
MKTTRKTLNLKIQMKNFRYTSSRSWAGFYFLALASAFCFRVAGQNYSVDWYKVSGGGGTSAGGSYALSGTTGQPDAGGSMTGGNYSITGGFWALYAVQTPGAPMLKIQWINATTVKVSWPSPSTGFVLQQNNDLNTANWSNYPGTVSDDGTTKSVTITPPSGSLFFRLKK